MRPLAIEGAARLSCIGSAVTPLRERSGCPRPACASLRRHQPSGFLHLFGVRNQELRRAFSAGLTSRVGTMQLPTRIRQASVRPVLDDAPNERKRRRTVSGISQSSPSASLRIAAFSYVESASHTAVKFSRLLTVTADLQ